MDIKDDNNENSPPFFKSWKQVYLFVMVVFGIIVALFYVFSKTFN